jgi:hypothetical protein
VRTAVVRSLVIAAVLGGGVMPRSAPAKEHTAACPELAGMIGRVRASLEAAGGQRQRGSSMGAYQVLLSTVGSMVRESGGDHCGALGPTLSSALRRAATSRTALDASVELDLGLDAALSLATDGHLPFASSPPKIPFRAPAPSSSSSLASSRPTPVGEAAVYAQDCPDLFALTLRLDGPAQSLPERVKVLLSDLQARPRCAYVRRVLESASAERLPHAVDSIRLDEPDEADVSPDGGLLARCPELPLVVERLASAIEVGAPQYNAGDAAACLATYQQAARAVTSRIVGEERCPIVRSLLAAGVARAESAPTSNEAAWAMRHSFDAILSGPLGGPSANPMGRAP